MRIHLRIAPFTVIFLFTFVCLNAWLLAVVLAELAPESTPPPPTLDAGKKNLGQAIDLVSPKPFTDYSDTLAKPVFFKTRSPYVPPPPKPPAPPAIPPQIAIPDPDLSVAGIIIKNGLKKAYLLKKTDPAGTWVAEGEQILGWTARSIGPEGVALQLNNRTIELKIYPTQ